MLERLTLEHLKVVPDMQLVVRALGCMTFTNDLRPVLLTPQPSHSSASIPHPQCDPECCNPLAIPAAYCGLDGWSSTVTAPDFECKKGALNIH